MLHLKLIQTKKITNIRRWEQAFRIYGNIYSKANPTRATEIWQYVEIINRAAKKFSWENVASYDYQFRQWMSRNPMRSWSKLFQEIWTLEMVDPLQKFSQSNNSNSVATSKQNSKPICWKFNRGKCEFGQNCRFEHRCAYCLALGHPSIYCRRKNNRSGSGRQNSSGETNNSNSHETKPHKDKKSKRSDREAEHD